MLFAINWKNFDRLSILRDRRTGDVALVRGQADYVSFVPLFLFDETIGM